MGWKDTIKPPSSDDSSVTDTPAPAKSWRDTVTPPQSSFMGANFDKSAHEDMNALKGLTSGMTYGGQGILGGATQAGLDLGQQGLNKLGLASPSPTQVNAQLAAQGVTGNVGPTNTSGIYSQGKKETQVDFAKAEAESPKAYGAAQLAGALISPANKLIPGMGLSKALADAPAAVRIAAQAAKGSLLGAVIGGTTGFLGGPHDLIGPNANPSGVLQDVTGGAGTGAVTGGLLSGGISALGEAGNYIGKQLPKLKGLANNRAAASLGVDSKTNMAPIYKAEDAAEQGFETRATPKSVGQTLLENDATTMNPIKFNRDITKNIQSKVDDLESQLQNELKKTQQGITPTANAQEAKYDEDFNKHLASVDQDQLSLPGMTDDLQTTVNKPQQVEVNGKPAQTMAPEPAIPREQTFLSPLPQEQLGLFNPVNNDNQLTQLAQQNAMDTMSKGEISSLSKQGEFTGTELTPKSYTEGNVPGIEAKSGQLSMGPGGETSLPEAPKAVLTREQLTDQINNSISGQISHLDMSIHEDVKTKAIILEEINPLIDNIIKNANDPIALNLLKRRLTKIAYVIDRDTWKLGEEAKPRADMYKGLAGILKNQIETLAEQLQPGLGKKIADINATMGNLMEAKGSLEGASSRAIGSGDLIVSTLRNIGNAVTAPGNAAISKAANALSNITPENSAAAINKVTTPAQQTMPGLINNKVQKKNIYNQNQEKYKQYGDKLSANPSTAHLGNALNAAIDSNNSLGQTQALFVIQQNPHARKVIDEGNEGEQYG